MENQQLLDIEKKWQAVWEQAKQFEVNPPKDFKNGDPKKKFFITFPFPYMNGRLHLGHLFTVSKTEFAAGYHIMNGYNTLFPFAFHATGQPICGAAKKLEQELQNKNNQNEIAQLNEANNINEIKDTTTHLGEFKAKRTKAAAKSSNKLQSEILLEMGVPNDQIEKFVDPYEWVRFFPDLCIKDMKRFGARVDWRRSFVTTDLNPIFDRFVKWQFTKLKKLGFIKFGKRNTVWSPLDQQPCMDHDRISGEGVQIQEYVLVLAQVTQHQNNKNLLQTLKDNEKLYFACATLRPETMCGQTNIWVHPEKEYQMIRIDSDTKMIVSEHAAKNLAHQGFNNGLKMGEVDLVQKVQGAALINCVAKAPLTIYDEIPVLPLMTISMTKGTGVVTSVPSDAPDDYQAVQDIQNNFENIVEKYSIQKNLLQKMVDIIEIPGIGVSAAARLCEERQVKNQYDKQLLHEIKEICYSKGFYEGVMITGQFKGKRVQDCKLLYKDYLINQSKAIIYAEPEQEIIARSGCICVVAAAEQYYIDYADQKWKDTCHSACKNINFYSDEVQNQFARVIDWLRQWALSRTFGLGTRIPWDEAYLIESLSDSTIYNAFYTIADVLQNGDLYGVKSPLNVEQLSDEFFDFVFDLEENETKFSGKLEELALQLKKEFQFYYPVDLRCSGKDLVPNHLAFFVFNHCAVWAGKPQYWPRGIRANGHLLLNGEKMSKSTGNFMTAFEAIQKYSADAVRMALADAGDGADDADFRTEAAESAITKLVVLQQNYTNIFQKSVERVPEKMADFVFQAQYLQCATKANKAFEKCLFREGTIITMNEMQKARDLYLRTCEQQQLSVCTCLVKEYAKLHTQLLAVICPHIAEEINEQILLQKESIFKQFLDQEQLEAKYQQCAKYISMYEQVNLMIARLRMRYNDVCKPKKDGTVPPKPKTGTIYIAREFLEWQKELVVYLRQEYEKCGGNFGKDITGNARAYVIEKCQVDQKEVKKIIKFVTDLIALSKTEGVSVFVDQMPFDEQIVYREYSFLVCQLLQLEKVEIYQINEGPVSADKCVAAQPGRPIIFFDL